MNSSAERKINIRWKEPAFRIKGFLPTIVVCVCIILGTYNNKFAYLGFLLSILSILILSKEDTLAFMLFLLPFSTIFKSGPNGQSFHTYLIFFYIGYNIITSRGLNKTFFTYLVLLGAYIVGQMLMNISISRTIKFMANFLFIYYALNVDNEKVCKKVFLYYIFAFILSSLVSAFHIIPNLTDYVVVKALEGSGGGILRFAGMYVDPNHYSINLIISLCLIIILNHKKQLNNLNSLLLAGLLLIFAIMTISKSAFLMFSLPLTLLLYSRIKKRKYFIFAFLLIILITFMFLLVEGKIGIFDLILSRFEKDEDIDSLTTGRFELFQRYTTYLSKNIDKTIIGSGFAAPYLGGTGPHNTYIDMLYHLGIIGSILLILVMRALLICRNQNSNKNLLNYSVWICIGIMYCFLSKIFYFDVPFHFILAILAMNTDCNTTMGK